MVSKGHRASLNLTRKLYLYIYLFDVEIFTFLNFYYIREFVNQRYKTEKLFIALNKLAQNQSLHPRCNTLSYILFLTYKYIN